MERFDRILLADNFYLDELVSPEIYNIFGAASQWFVKPELINLLQFLRDQFGVIIVNNWSQQGKVTAQIFLEADEKTRNSYFAYSGVRPHLCRYGAEFSIHKYGGAADPKFLDSTPDQVRRDIICNYHKKYKPKGLTAIELGTKTWVHIDTRNSGINDLLQIHS